MPRILVDVSDEWLKRYQQGVSDCIDTLTGLEHQLRQPRLNSLQEAYEFTEQISEQLLNLRRNVESWRLMF